MDPLSPDADLFTGAFGVIFVLFGILFVGALVFIVVVSVRRYQAVKRAGYDPLTVDAQLVTRVMDSDLLRPAGSPDAGAPVARPASSMEQRLREVDDLFARGVISADEHTSARAEILRG